MEFWRSLGGMVELELTGADIPGTLRSIGMLGIETFDVRTDGGLTAWFCIERRKYPVLQRLANKRGDRLRIRKKLGIFWTAKQLLRRPVLAIGLLILAMLMCYLPTRVLFIEVEGNSHIPDQQILSAAEESGIRFWASRRQVRSEKMKNMILSRVPELQWAGINTYGCVAVISVRERAETEEQPQEKSVSSIIASRDGVILDCTVTRGSALCVPGQAVRKGSVLISGYVDHGLCVSGVQAEGEITALTRREITAVTPSVIRIRPISGREEKKYSLIIGKKRINFFKGSGIYEGTCVKMYSEYVLTLPGGFALPVTLREETVISQQLQNGQFDENRLPAHLSEFADSYLRQQMIAGSVLNREESFGCEGGLFRLTGSYACAEMIGKRQQEQIGEYNGKTG